MINTTDIQKIKDILTTAKDVLVVTHEHATPDSMGSTLALSLGLQALGKKVTVAAPEAMTVELSNFVGANKVVLEVGKKNFIISLDYLEGSIEKVSYNIEGNQFNLVIEPRPGFDSFSQDKVHYRQAGSAVDVIICVDTIHLGGLKKIYESDKDLFASKPIVNIDRHPNNTNFGQINIVDSQASSTAEVVAAVLTELSVAMTQDIATNLLNAVFAATNNFTNPSVTAAAFEVAATATKAGAVRFRRSVPVSQSQVQIQSQPQVQMPVSPTPSPEEIPVGEAAMTMAPEQNGHSMGMAPSQPMQSALPRPAQQPPKPQEAPSDWLKPKIFKSSNLI